MFSNLESRELILVCGKGGVGRTTVSAAIALASSGQHRRTLLALCDPQRDLASLTGAVTADMGIQRLEANLDVVALHPQAALREYFALTLRVKALVRGLVSSKAAMAFIHATPGVDAWSMLGKAYFHSQEKMRGVPRYQCVVFDAPATGHALEMLQVPYVLQHIAPPGRLRKDAVEAVSAFQNPNRTAALLVALPEEMPVSEALELRRKLTTDFGIHNCRYVLNRWLEIDGLSPEVLNREQAGETHVLKMYRRRLQRQETQRARLLNDPAAEVSTLAERFCAAVTPDDYQSLAAEMTADLTKTEVAKQGESSREV